MEQRTIRAYRFARLGRTSYAAGNLRAGAGLMLKAAALGHQPFGSLAFLVLASPPCRRIKRHLKYLFHSASTWRNAGNRPSSTS
jgi:hypothetical protein